MSDFVGQRHTYREAGGFSFGHWFATPDTRPHVHAEAHFMFIIAGEYATSLSGRSNLMYNPPNTFHRDRFESGGSFFGISVPAEFAPRTASTRIDDPRVHAKLGRLMFECMNWTDDSADVAEALCLQMLGTEVESRAPRWLEHAREALRDQSCASIATLARDAGVHPIHLTRTFGRFYGCTPGEYLRQIRAHRAAQMLTESAMPLSEVALESGFGDQSHFTRVFRRAYGISPGAYRRATRKGLF